MHIRLRGDCRGARRLVDQGHFAEGVAGTETSDLLAVHRHGCLAALDDDERSAALALFGNRLAGAEGALHELAGKLLEEAVVGRCKERDSADQIEARLRHGRILRLLSASRERRAALEWAALRFFPQRPGGWPGRKGLGRVNQD